MPLRKSAHILAVPCAACWAVLQWLWALPLTLLGLAFWSHAFFYKQKYAQAHIWWAQAAPVFVAHSPLIAWCLKRHPWGEMQAVALGCCVLAQDAALLRHTWPHEAVHVQQALRWGPLFPLAYAACSVWAFAQGRCIYADNYFERQANKDT